MEVRRIYPDGPYGGSHVEPPFNESWTEREKIDWHAAITEFDSGIEVVVSTGGSSRRVLGKLRPIGGVYGFILGGGVMATSERPYLDCCTFLHGLSVGANLVRRQMEDNQ